MGHGLISVAMSAPFQQFLRLLLLLSNKPATISSRPIFRTTTALPRLLLLVVLLLVSWSQLALADCECGYLSTINGTTASTSNDGSNNNNNGQYAALFTELLETDFTSVHSDDDDDDLFHNTDDWARQAFNLTRERARGDYGEMFAAENVRVRGRSSSSGGPPPSPAEAETQQLELVVGSELVDGMVPVAELDTQRLDLLWGTFRASMKMSRVEGTCAAFFWYFNDTQEIDMEFLSKDFNAANRSYPVNLVLQSRDAALAGYDASKTGNFVKAYLPFDPTADFHEYRIDYLPGRVFFYADGAVLAEMDGPAVPSSPGHLILQHWSNGNRYWSGGPPTQDAALAVRYVKAYFNSSLTQRHRDWEARCRDPTAPKAVCRIPDVTPDDSSAAGWFFMDQKNMTNNQTVSEEQSLCSTLKGPWWSSVAWLSIVGAWALML